MKILIENAFGLAPNEYKIVNGKLYQVANNGQLHESDRNIKIEEILEVK